ncbi:MAG: hypothetical protein R2882_12755 [Gemmatimonadales bacterium]
MRSTAAPTFLERFGGHKMAAGLTVRRDRVDEFRERFAAICAETLDPTNLGPSSGWTPRLAWPRPPMNSSASAAILEPHDGKLGPVFLARSAELVNWSYVGQKSEHFRGFLKDRTGGGVYRRGSSALRPGRLAGLHPGRRGPSGLERHEFRGRITLSCASYAWTGFYRADGGHRAA